MKFATLDVNGCLLPIFECGVSISGISAAAALTLAAMIASFVDTWAGSDAIAAAAPIAT
jgi:hypothetical protein